MSLRKPRARYKISCNKSITALQYKIIEMICKIVTHDQRCQQERAQIFLRGSANFAL